MGNFCSIKPGCNNTTINCRARSPSLDLSNSLFTTQSSECLEHNPDWIETNATAMGYVKHPLEQLLEWLDLAILWLEDVFSQVLALATEL